MFKKPNFFIIGAPKCGTTSLAAWLAEHPNIFITRPKEPEFFNDDIAPLFRGGVRKYEALYRGVQAQHTAIGEASTIYLRSRSAISNIMEYQPNAKFIVGVRHPVNFLISWHGQMLRNGWENETDLVRAWELQDDRRRGKNIPALCPDVQHLMYGNVCTLGTQLERMIQRIEKDRYFLYSLDEMANNKNLLWSSVCEFLGVSAIEKASYPVINEGVFIPKWLVTSARLVDEIKQRIGLRWHGLGLFNGLKNITSTPMKRSIDDKFKAELTSFFASETEILENIVGRKLIK